jgi:hypothetical protein
MGKILTKEIAQKVIEKADSADLSKYSELEDDAAQILAGFPSYLNLKGLKTLTDKAARALLPHESGLYLNGLQKITDSLASILSNYQGYDLRLEGIKKISDSAARTLAKLKNSLSLGLTELSDKQAGLLAKHFSDNSGNLSLQKLKTLSGPAARSLGKHKGGCLDLDGIVELSDEAVFGLVQSDALSLNGLRKISDTALETLISYHMEGGTLYILTLRERFLAAKAKRADEKAMKKSGGKKKA